MTVEEFKDLNNFHFSEKDIFGRYIKTDLEKIQPELMYKIDEAVSFAKQEYTKDQGKFRVHCIVLGEHADGSRHYTGEAIDGHFKGLNLYQSVMIGLKTGFTGVGFYPDWKHPGVHFDIRPQIHVSTWMYWNGEYIYDFDEFLERLLFEADK